jgi:hypothetical protein
MSSPFEPRGRPSRRIGGFSWSKRRPRCRGMISYGARPNDRQSSRIWARWTRRKVPRAGESSQLFAGMRDTQGPRLRNGVDADSACVSAFVDSVRNDERYRVFEDCTSFRHARSGSNAKRVVAQEGTGKVAITRAPPAMGSPQGDLRAAR